MILSLPLGISNPLIVSRTFPGLYESLASIGQFVRAQALISGLDDKAVYQVEMAVDEACSNIIEHAYGSENKGEIALTCQSDEKGFTVVLRDTGRPFNPDSVDLPDLTTGLEERESHGLGLFFIREWMDQVHFDYKPGVGNILTMFKRRGGSRRSSSKTADKP
jgi:serine/threonine-protein kinase RsbW